MSQHLNQPSAWTSVGTWLQIISGPSRATTPFISSPDNRATTSGRACVASINRTLNRARISASTSRAATSLRAGVAAVNDIPDSRAEAANRAHTATGRPATGPAVCPAVGPASLWGGIIIPQNPLHYGSVVFFLCGNFQFLLFSSNMQTPERINRGVNDYLISLNFRAPLIFAHQGRAKIKGASLRTRGAQKLEGRERFFGVREN